jgi:hypothetical protein
VYFLSRKRVPKMPRRFYEIKWAFSGEKFPRKQKAERSRWNSPLLAKTIALSASSGRRSGKSRIVDTIGRGGELLIRDTLFQVELAISLPNVQKSIDTLQQLAQQPALQRPPHPASGAPGVCLPPKPDFGIGPPRFEYGLPIGSHLPALDPKRFCADPVERAIKATLESQRQK